MSDVTISIGVEGAASAAAQIESVGGAAGMLGNAFDALGNKLAETFSPERIASAVAEWTREAERLGDVMQGLGGRSAEAVEVFGVQLVSSIDAASARTRLLNADLDISDAQFQALQLHAAAYAATTGQEVAPTLDRLTNALIQGSERGMRPFGFELQQGATRAQNQAAALAAMTAALDQNRTTVERSTGALDAWDGVVMRAKERAGAFFAALLDAPIQAYNDSVTAGVPPMEAFADRLVRLNNTVPSLTGNMSALTATLWAYRHAAAAAAGVTPASLPTPGEARGLPRDEWGGGATGRDPGESAVEMRARIARDRQRLTDFYAQVIRDRSAADPDFAAGGMILDTQEALADRARRRGGGGGGGTDLPDDYYQQVGARRAEEASARQREWDRARAEDIRAQIAEAASEADDRRARAGSGRTGKGAGDGNVAQARNESRAVAGLAAEYERFGDRGKAVLDAMGAAWESHFAAFAKGKETFSEAMRGMTASVLEALAAQALKESAFQAAAALASLAIYDYGGAALHFAAAAGFGALALGGYALGGVVEGGGHRASSAASRGAGQNSTRDLGPGDRSGGNTSITYVLQGNTVVGSGGMREFVGMIDRTRNAGAQIGRNQPRITQASIQRT